MTQIYKLSLNVGIIYCNQIYLKGIKNFLISVSLTEIIILVLII